MKTRVDGNAGVLEKEVASSILTEHIYNVE